MMELLDNVADENPTRCDIEVRARAGGATVVALRNDVRDRAASVLDALSLMRSEKRGPGALIGENGVGLKAAAAKLGGGAVVLTARRAAQSFVIRRGARRETVGEGAAVFEVGVLAESLQRMIDENALSTAQASEIILAFDQARRCIIRARARRSR